MEMSKNVRDGDRAEFSEAYASLNAAQKKAVDTTEGPVMVIAGPGTGKTQILTLRIANILLKTDTAPESILALTFTESGAKAMRERLRRYIGATAYRIPIYTFHGFAGSLISDYPDAFSKIIGGKPASDLSKIGIIESVLEGGEVRALRPAGNPAYYVTPILRMIGTLKQEYLTPEKFSQVITKQEEQLAATPKVHEKGAHKGKVRGEYTKLEKSIEKNRELLYVYQRYEALLREQGLYDFEDMLIEAVTALKADESMLRDLQERYQYVLADEHQDVNGTQNELLEILVSYHEQPNIFVVGDEKQAIYRFQGASLENFLYFEERFSGTTTISLTENYRSAQGILDVAHDLIATDDERLAALRVPLTAATDTKAEVATLQFSHQVVEDTWVVESVSKSLASGIPAEEIAIIVRTNREVEQLAAALRKSGIAAEASAEGDILTHPITQSVSCLLRAIAAPEDQVALAAVLHLPCWKISPSDLARVLAAQNYSRTLTDIITDGAVLEEIGVVQVASVTNVATVLATVVQSVSVQAPQQSLELLLQHSGFLDSVVELDPFEGVRVIRRLYDEVEEMVVSGEVTTVGEVVAALSQRQAYGLPLNAPYINTNESAVQVMTAHKAKGLEFTKVFMPHVVDRQWGGSVKRNYFTIPLTKHLHEAEFDALDDERRLLYVGITRAKLSLTISYSDTNTAGKEETVSRLLLDIDDTLLEKPDTTDFGAAFSPTASLEKVAPAIAIDAATLTSLFNQRGFSATSINNYLRSPWDYFYRNLLRLPETQAPAMQYGTVVHNVLEKITKAHSGTKKLPTPTEVKTWLQYELERLPITEVEYNRLLERGLESLTVYQEHLATVLPTSTKEELSISVVLETGLADVPEIKLTGKLDRIDLGENGKALRVVDYKTGKARTRNAIEGKTKFDDGGYKRQLVFYALLLELYDDERYRTREGVLSFVEPDSKGAIKEEVFVITDEEIETLKREIIDATQEIVSGAFLIQECDPEKSSYCDLVSLLRQRGEG